MFAITMGGTIAQVAAGLIELKNGDESGGNLMFTMGCLFMFAPGISFLMAALKIAVPVPIVGYINLMLAIYQAIYGISMIYNPWFVFSMAVAGVLTLTQIGLIELGYTFFKPTCALGCAYLCFWALYMIAHRVATTVNINIPIGKPLLQPRNAAIIKNVTPIADSERSIPSGSVPVGH